MVCRISRPRLNIRKPAKLWTWANSSATIAATEREERQVEIDLETALQLIMFVVAFAGMYLGFLKDSM